ncbi:ARM repeat-containing protein [Leucogyrophana mollusca]|uniref:ARM repeat-containing protein n=1 Tax=Leucogyrophana mollusca TaxID=85980 RepID=A0ACB8BG08_9AGAM|nr:ARM repeat-containing protein [Leucogyrophana mollusca]
MDYLRNLGSAAVSSLVQKSGLNLPFSLGPKVASNETFWNLYDATKRDDSSPVSVFEYDLIHPLNKSTIPLARNALRKLRTIRHPDVLKFMDVVETDSVIYIMTERVRPLPAALQTWSAKNAQEREDWLLWGLHRVSVALAFVNESCASTHGNIGTNAIFISPSGEWKLGGFEVLSNPKDDVAVLYTMGGLLPDSMARASPEVKKSGWSSLKEQPVSAGDAYALGLLLHSIFNPTHPLPPTSQPPHPPPQPSSRGAIPPSVFPSFKKLLNPNPKARMAPKTFLETGMAESGDAFFARNKLVKICAGLDNFALAGESEKSALLRTLKESVTSFPPEFASHRVLPSLLSALDHAGASASSILPLVLALGVNVPPHEYDSIVLVPLVKLYASPDRGTRMALLDSLPEYAEKLDKRAVADRVWPHLQTGFSDTVAVIREATVRAVVLLAPKLSDRILNNDLLRHLARMQSDPEASIRTNTCILIGRLGPTLGYNTKKKVLIPAFGKAIKDPFVHARVAGVMAFMACAECFEMEDIAGRVVPCVASAMLDKEKLVRDQAFRAVELFVKRLETHAAAMVSRFLCM